MTSGPSRRSPLCCPRSDVGTRETGPTGMTISPFVDQHRIGSSGSARSITAQAASVVDEFKPDLGV
jgi:hypothetical protein